MRFDSSKAFVYHPFDRGTGEIESFTVNIMLVFMG